MLVGAVGATGCWRLVALCATQQLDSDMCGVVDLWWRHGGWAVYVDDKGNGSATCEADNNHEYKDLVSNESGWIL